MRIGIYNRYWSTRGGGERYAGTMAEILARDHEVELVGEEPESVSSLASHLELDLSRVGYRRWSAGASTAELTRETRRYDLFVNATFWSGLPAAAARSLYICYFPQRLLPAPFERLERALAAALERRLGGGVRPLAGFFGVEHGAFRWTGERARLRLEPEAFARGRAELRFRTEAGRELDETLLEVAGDGFDWEIAGDRLLVSRRSGAPPALELELRSRTFSPAEAGGSDRRRLGLCLVLSRPRGARTSRRALGRLAGRGRLYGRAFIPTYDVIASISEYSRGWMRRRWGVDSLVLPPPVDTAAFTPPADMEKERVILSVGRFFAGSHNKKHLELVRVFRRLCDRGAIPSGWEYHMVGNVHRSKRQHVDYFAEVERLARGYPVRILADLPFPRLQEEYRRAAIFWHAAGWGESDWRKPENSEHFGLTTCEAMSAGCLPVVIAKAGQLEIVDHGETGYFFDDAAGLARHTREIIAAHGSPASAAMRRRVRAAAERYGKPAFERALREILARPEMRA